MSRGRGRGLLRDETPPLASNTANVLPRPAAAESGLEAQPAQTSATVGVPAATQPIKILEARITTILDLWNFWAQLGRAEDLTKFDQFSKELSQYCDSKGKGVGTYPNVGELVAVKMSDTGKWARVKVTRHVSTEKVREVEVFHVDSGTSGRVPLQDLCSSPPPMLYACPLQGLQCRLHGVQMPDGVESWSQEAVAHFAMLVSGPKAHTKAVVHDMVDGCFSVSLYTLLDGHWNSVGEALKERNIALYVSSEPPTIDHLVSSEDIITDSTSDRGTISEDTPTTTAATELPPDTCKSPQVTIAQGPSPVTPLETPPPIETSKSRYTSSEASVRPELTPSSLLETPQEKGEAVTITGDVDSIDGSPPPLTQPEVVRKMKPRRDSDHRDDEMPPLSSKEDTPSLDEQTALQMVATGTSASGGGCVKEDEAVIDGGEGSSAVESECVTPCKLSDIRDDRSGSVTPLAVDESAKQDQEFGENHLQTETSVTPKTEEQISKSSRDTIVVPADVKGQGGKDSKPVAAAAAGGVHSSEDDDALQLGGGGGGGGVSGGDSLSSSDEWDDSLLPPSTHSESSEASFSTPQESPVKNKTGDYRSGGLVDSKRDLQETLEIADMIYSANQHSYPKRQYYRKKQPHNQRQRKQRDQSPSLSHYTRSQEPFRDFIGGNGRGSHSDDMIRSPSHDRGGAGSTGMGRGVWLSGGEGERKPAAAVGRMKGVSVRQRGAAGGRTPGGRGVPRHRQQQQQQLPLPPQQELPPPPLQLHQQQFSQEHDAGTTFAAEYAGHHQPQPGNLQSKVITGLSESEVANEANWSVFNIEKDVKQIFKNLTASNLLEFAPNIENILQGKHALNLLSIPATRVPVEVVLTCIMEETVSNRPEKIDLNVVTAAVSCLVKTVADEQVYQLLQVVLDEKAREISEDSAATDAGRRRQMFCFLLGKLFIAASSSENEKYHSCVAYSVKNCLDTWTKYTPGLTRSHWCVYADCLKALCEEIGPTMDASEMKSLDVYFDGPIMELIIGEQLPRAALETLVKLALKRARKWDGEKPVSGSSLVSSQPPPHQAQVPVHQQYTPVGMSNFSQEAPGPASNLVQPIPINAPPLEMEHGGQLSGAELVEVRGRGSEVQPGLELSNMAQQLPAAQEPVPLVSPSQSAFIPTQQQQQQQQIVRSLSLGAVEQAPLHVHPSMKARSLSDSTLETPYIEVEKMLEDLKLLVLLPEFKKGMLSDHLLDCDDASTLKGCLQDSGIPAGAIYRIVEYNKKWKQRRNVGQSSSVDSLPSTPVFLSAPPTPAGAAGVMDLKTPYQMQMDGTSVQLMSHQAGTRQVLRRPHSVVQQVHSAGAHQQAAGAVPSGFIPPPQVGSASPYQLTPTSGQRPTLATPQSQTPRAHTLTPYPTASMQQQPAAAQTQGSGMYPGPVLPSDPQPAASFTYIQTPQQQQQQQSVTPSYQSPSVVSGGTQMEAASADQMPAHFSCVTSSPSGYQGGYGIASLSSPSTAQRTLTILTKSPQTSSTQERGITVRLPHSPKQPQTGQTQEKHEQEKRGGFGRVKCLLCGSNSHSTPSCQENRGSFFFH